MRILLGTHYLAKTGGTESYTFALAMELKRLGHEVEHFAIIRGGVSSMLEEKGVPFMTSDHYDLILANHTTVVEQLWPKGFIVQTCHGNIAELEQPSPYADAYVAVSEEVREHLRSKGYRAAAVIANGIDCNRFCQKKPVSPTLQTVLSLCQSDVANDFIRRCCQQEGIRFLQSNMDFQVALYPAGEVGEEGFAALCRRLEGRREANAQKRPGVYWDTRMPDAAAGDADIVGRAKAFIARNLSRNISRGDVASEVHLTEEYFSRLFSRQTGFTFKDYLLNEKMNAAKKLLVSSGLSVSIVASKVGYDNFSHFSQIFKKVVGETPQEYRKNHGN